MEKTIFVGLILGIVATIAVATTSAMSTVYASNDGSRQCSEGSQDDKNCLNAIDNYKKHKERAFDKDNNDQGQQRTLENLEDKQP